MIAQQFRDYVMKLNREECLEVHKLLISRLSIISQEAVNNFQIGDHVSFKGKNNITYEGFVTKVNRSTIGVNVEPNPLIGVKAEKWNVAASCLSLCP